jgi:outer membrane protein OmpA-like peptidoglycan-associated protein
MKKVFVTFIALLAISSSIMADGHIDSVRYLTTRWGKNWYVSAGATANWWQGSMNVPETFTNSYNKVEWSHPNIGFTVNFGKWINHKTAVRLSYNNTRIHSYMLGRHTNLSHIQYLYGENPEIAETVGGQSIYKTSMRYHNLEAQYMVSPIDFFQGYYNPDRIWTPILYASMGAALNSNDLLVTQSLIHYINYKKDKDVTKYNGTNFELALGAGLLNNFRISEHFDIFLDVNWTFHRWTIDTWTYEFGGNAFCTSLEEVRPKRFDNMYTAALGVTYYFSRVYDLCEQDTVFLAPDTTINVDAPCDTIVKFVNMQTEDILSYPFSIFFHRDSYQLMSRRDIVNLREIANVAKENGYKLRLTGSCDSATATPAYNQTLSENRCNKIKYELMELGIPEDQIILEPIGGVKQLDPTEYDRRVLIQLVKEAQ